MDGPTRHDFKISEVIIIITITCVFSALAGISYGKVRYSNGAGITSGESVDGYLGEFIKQYRYIISNYYDRTQIDEQKLLNKALSSIVEEIGANDHHSLYMNEDDYSDFNINLAGEYNGIGIGAYKINEDDYINVLYIIDNSPAQKVDLKSGDIIVAIDGKDTKEMTVKEFSHYVLDSDDKTFLLRVKRGDDTFNVNVVKDKVEITSVVSEVIEHNQKHVGYISISIFASNTYAQFAEQLEALEKENIDSLIIDVRNNTGGHLAEVTKIISLFLDDDHVIYQLQKDDDVVKYYSKGKEDKKYPIVFLTNENTASASEVFILGIKENIGATIVGTKTYGKGTVQGMVELSNGDKYKITTKKWLSPNGNWVNDTEGINPDVEVDLNETFASNPITENDNQLKEALEQATAKTK